MYELIIENLGVLYQPIVLDDIKLTWERQGSPGKLEFKVIQDEVLNFQEGNPVRFKVDGQDLFFGYVWSESQNKDKVVSVIVYDQLRYFKFKDTLLYTDKKAGDIVRLVAAKQNLKVGDIADTSYTIQQRLRDNETYFDMIYDALELTFDNTKKLYVLYDDFGRLTLKDIETMRLDVVVGNDTAEDYDYSTTLDDVYNQIKLAFDNEETGKREVYIAKDSDNINNWGVLQYFEKIDEITNGQVKANALLELYNRKKRTLTVKKAIGDIRVRGGSSIFVYLPDLNNISIKNYMLVDSVVHTFADNEHWMDIKVRGRL